MKLRRLSVYLLIIVCLTLGVPGRLVAQSPDMTAFWEMDISPGAGWHVGDVIPMRLRVIAPSDAAATLPQLPDTWGPFEIREQKIDQPVQREQTTESVLAIKAQLWNVGLHTTPATTVTVDIGGEETTVTVRPLNVEITSVLPEQVDSVSIEKRDLKPQANLPRPPMWPWVLAVASGMLLSYLAGRWIWHKIPHREMHVAVDKHEIIDNRLPEEIAYACLDHLTLMDLPGIGAFKQHYSMLSACLRVYLAAIYNIPAMDLTTMELKQALRQQILDAECASLLWELLDQADLVKFAKQRPDTTQARSTIRLARHFIDVTHPVRQESETVVQEAAR
ncbi:MAG: hypothetical protein P1S60_07195 [Anaerolineae bacterium]|nr:hypothetical protein [Anaerolineae bacterium]